MIARSLPRAATFNQAWDNLHNWRCFIKALLKIACVRRFRYFQLLVSLFERLSPSLVVIACETFVILIGCRILLAVHAGLREIVIRQIPLFLFLYM